MVGPNSQGRHSVCDYLPLAVTLGFTLFMSYRFWRTVINPYKPKPRCHIQIIQEKNNKIFKVM